MAREVFDGVLGKQQRDWIITSRISSDYLGSFPPQGRVYLPTASYSEMGEWTLPSQAQGALDELRKRVPHEEEEAGKRFIRGGFWRNFFTKYEESNNLHKKMLRVSRKVHEVAGASAQTRRPGAENAGRAVG